MRCTTEMDICTRKCIKHLTVDELCTFLKTHETAIMEPFIRFTIKREVMYCGNDFAEPTGRFCVEIESVKQTIGKVNNIEICTDIENENKKIDYYLDN